MPTHIQAFDLSIVYNYWIFLFIPFVHNIPRRYILAFVSELQWRKHHQIRMSLRVAGSLHLWNAQKNRAFICTVLCV